MGKTLALGPHERTVTGVVKDSGVNALQFPESAEVYVPFADRAGFMATFLVRTAGAPAALASTLRSAVSRPALSPQVFTMQSLVDQRLDSMEKMVRVVGSLAAIASLMAMLGIFGLLAFTVAQRTREIGVRMALGARRADVLACVIGQFLMPFGMGVAGGTVLAFGVAKIIRNLLYGFLPFDFAGFGTGLLIFAAVALIASIAPARRALRIDPASALRYE